MGLFPIMGDHSGSAPEPNRKGSEVQFEPADWKMKKWFLDDYIVFGRSGCYSLLIPLGGCLWSTAWRAGPGPSAREARALHRGKNDSKIHKIKEKNDPTIKI